MPLADLVRALPAAVLVGLVPGLALATLAAPRWRWWERFAGAPALGAGLVGVIGLAMHDTHVPFRPATVLPAEAAVVAAGALRWRLAARASVAAHAGAAARPGLPALERGQILAVVGAALVAGATACGVISWQLRDAPLPPDRDSALHAAVATQITRTQDALPFIAEPVDAGATVRTRDGLEAEAAVVSDMGGGDPASTVLPVTLLGVLLLPLGIAALTWEAAGSAMAAAVAAWVALLVPFPSFALSFGEMPLVLDSTLVFMLVLAAWRTARRVDARGSIALAGVCVAANWMVHGTEVLTALAVGGWPVAAALWRRRDAGAARRFVALAAVCTAGAVVVTLLTRFPSVPAGSPDPLGTATVPESNDFASLVGHRRLVDAVFTYTTFMPGWPLLLILGCTGGVAALRLGRMRWMLVAEFAILVIYLDSLTVGALRRLWTAVYPWANDDRLMAMQVFTLAPLAGLGLAVLAGEVRARWPRLPARAALAMSTAVAAACAAIGVGRSASIMSDAAGPRAIVTAADVRALTAMSSVLRPGAVVLSDDADAGVWISALTSQRLFMSWPYLRSHPGDIRVATLASCGTGPLDPRMLAGIDAVYAGARPYPGSRSWSVDCLAKRPGLHAVVVIRDGTELAGVFAVDHHGSAG